MKVTGDLNGNPAPGSREPDLQAIGLFQALAAELEEGQGDPESLFAEHPELEGELRRLYRGWLEADALFRDLAWDESVVHAVRTDLKSGSRDERLILTRLSARGFAERYELGQELGHGGMGVVRRVTDRVLGRELAMKVIRPVEPGRRRRLLRRFLEEAEVVGRLEHPGIVPIHELGLDAEGHVYFTMPLVRGSTLQEILRLSREGRDEWSLARVLEVLLKVCDAVAYAHSRGVLHRDLKPANVMVGRFGEAYVMDWGLARSLGALEEASEPGEETQSDPLTLEGEVLGTPAYMAPEQARGGLGGLDERCDVYALGAILYETLAGVRPYGECSSAEALERLGRERPEAVETLSRGASEELCAIVRRAMAREREERYPSVAALAADLRAFLEGRVVRAHRTGPWVEAKKWVLRNRRLAASLSVAGLALVAGLVASMILLGRAERERANVFRLAQTRTLSSLVERAAGLWPVHPERIGELRAWQDEARALVRNLEPDEATGDAGLRAQLAGLAARQETWTDEDRWWHGELAKLVAGIEELADTESGLMGEGLGPHGFGIGRRLALAEWLRAESERPEVQARWQEARNSIRSDARYGGLVLPPQVGLVPLGPDPGSGLWEFAHLLTGETPVRGQDGRLVIAPGGGLVLVLVPGGDFWMGSQDSNPGEHNYVAVREQHELALAHVSVEAFLLSKYEITQVQWERTTGRNPSFHQSTEGAALLPVEQISWSDAREGLRRLGLRLPAEPEWEYSCRAGTETLFSWGGDANAFPRYANVRDLDLQDLKMARDPFEPLRDGFGLVAPIGSLLPNPWGFHDMHGNVFEWCEDLVAPRSDGPKDEDPASRVFRGGSFQRLLEDARCARRGGEIPTYVYRSIGVRPAASLTLQDE